MTNSLIEVLYVAPAIELRFFNQNIAAVVFGGFPFQPIAS